MTVSGSEAGTSSSSRQKLEKVVIRFAGDSGDGMQLTGDRFTTEAALFGNDLATQPNYPAEIRAPQGTLPGVSSFQIQIADFDILTAGDRPDVLVAMNPAALKPTSATFRAAVWSSPTPTSSPSATSRRWATRPIRWKPTNSRTTSCRPSPP